MDDSASSNDNSLKKQSLYYNPDDIAIIGMACRFPGAKNYHEFWKNLVAGKNSICEIPQERWNWKNLESFSDYVKSKWGGFIENIDKFDADYFGISAVEAESLDPQQRILLELMVHCIEDACYTVEEIKGSKIGVYIGACNRDYKELIDKEERTIPWHYLTGTSDTFLANRLSYYFNLNGPSIVIDTACSSSLVALHQAIQGLRNDDCTQAFVGGVNLLIHGERYIPYSNFGMLSPTGQCYAFSANADGYVRAEGASIILIKPLKEALEVGDIIHGVIKASSINHGGHARTITSPNPYAQAQVISQALKKSSINLNHISYIEAHGTGTPLGDPIEVIGLQRAFKTLAKANLIKLKDQYCGISTVKTNIGHTEAVSGIAGIIKVLLSMKHQQLIKLQNFSTPNQKLQLEGSPFYLITENQVWKNIIDKRKKIPRTAGVSSFGAGGVNAHVILIEPPQKIKPNKRQNKPYHIVTLSAKQPDVLERQINELLQYLEDNKNLMDLKLEAISYVLTTKRNHFSHRYAVVVSTIEDLQDQLESSKKELLNVNKQVSSINLQEEVKQHLQHLAKKNAKMSINEYKEILDRIAKLYICGGEIDWKHLYPKEGNQKIFLPAYPFLGKTYWIKKIGENQQNHIVTQIKNIEKTIDLKGDCGEQIKFEPYEAEWKESIANNANIAIKDLLLINADINEIDFLKKNLSNKLFCLSENDIHSSDDVKLISNTISHVIYFVEPPKIFLAINEAVAEIFNFSSKLIRYFGDKDISLIYAFPSILDPILIHAIAELAQKINSEQIKFRFKVLFLPPDLVGDSWSNSLFHELQLSSGKTEIIRYDANKRYVFAIKTNNCKKIIEEFKEKGIYLIVGNSHEIGLYLAKNYKAKLILLNFLHSDKEDFTDKVEVAGGSVIFVNHDNCKELNLPVEVKQINGVIYSSNIGTNNIISNSLQTVIDDILAIQHVDKLTKGQMLDCFVINSSNELANYSNLLAGIAYWRNLEVEQGKRTGRTTAVCFITKINQNSYRFEEDKMEAVLQQNLLQLMNYILKIDASKIVKSEHFSRYGFESITYTQFANHISHKFKITIAPTIFFECLTLEQLSDYLIKNFKTELTNSLGDYFSAKREYMKFEASDFSQLKTKPTSNDQILESSCSGNVKEKIAIIGFHGIFPGSLTLEEFWNNLAASKDLITQVPNQRLNWYSYCNANPELTSKMNKWGGFISDVDKFDAEFFKISPREAALMDPQQRLLLQVVWQAIEESGYAPESTSGQEVGLFVGVQFNDYLDLFRNQNESYHPAMAIGTAQPIVPNRISYLLNWHGPSEAINTACSSSLVAINRAVQALRSGECELAVAGGVSLMLTPETIIRTSQLGVLSPDGRCKAFDESANGYVKGEGVGVIILKPLAKALADKDIIHGVILSSAVNHGGRAQSLTAPNVQAQRMLLVKALQQAQISPETISYIEAHGTGTELGDPIEIEALKQAFNESAPNSKLENYCGIGTVKTNIGHLEPAAGIAGIIKVLLAMRHEKLPGIVNFNKLNPYIQLTNSPFYIVNQTQPWRKLFTHDGQAIPRRAGISSFGFGGSNAHIILEESPSVEEVLHEEKPFYLVTLSAKSEASLRRKINDLLYRLNNTVKLNLRNLSYTLNVGRGHYQWRFAIVINSIAILRQELFRIINNQVIESIINVAENKEIRPMYKELYRLTLSSIHQQNLSEADYQEKLLILADLYLHGVTIQWEELYKYEKPSKINLPGYPFEKTVFWFKGQENEIIKPLVANQESNDIISQNTDYALNYVKEIFSQILKLPISRLDSNATYEAFGVDSLLGMEIINRLEKDFGVISKTLLFEKNRLKDLASYLQENFPQKMLVLQGFQQEIASHVIQTTKAVHNREITIPSLKNHDDMIAIVGLSGKYPQADNLITFWQNLKNGKDCITAVPNNRWKPEDYPVTLGGVVHYFDRGGFISDVDKFDPAFFNISPRDASILMDPQERLFVQAAWSALEDAGYTRNKLEKEVQNNVGVFTGVTFHLYPMYFAEEWFKGNRLPINIQFFSIANRVSYLFNLRGPSIPVDTACSSSLTAIHMACESIKRQECKMALAGGVNLSLHPAKYNTLGDLGFLSNQGRCSSFAADGNGYVPGEGVGVVLLKPLQNAIEDGNHIYGVIRASSINHGGKTSGYTVPNPNAQAELIAETIVKAKVDPRTISYIEAHGTGTKLGDPIEINGLQQAFSQYTQDKQFCAIGSVKSNIGHLEAAAGISQLTKVLLQLKYKTIVPTLHAENLNPLIDFKQSPFYVQRELTEWRASKGVPRRAGISSFGAGGVNVHLIVEEYIPSFVSDKSIQPPFIFVLSAQTKESLHEYVEKILKYIEKELFTAIELNEKKILNEICYTLQTGREAMQMRLGFSINNTQELLAKLKNYLAYPEQAMIINDDRNQKIIADWLSGNTINWTSLYIHGNPNKISLPTYPFARRRCWVPGQAYLTEQVAIKDELHIKEVSPVAVTKVVESNINYSPEIKNFLFDLADSAESEKYEKMLLYCQKLLGNTLGYEVNELPNPQKGFFELGLESIQAMELHETLERQLQVKISDTAIFDYPNTDKFARYLLELLPLDQLNDNFTTTSNDECQAQLDGLINKITNINIVDLNLSNPDELPTDILEMTEEELINALQQQFKKSESEKEEFTFNM